MSGLILLRGFHFHYWLATGRASGCKNCFKYERFILYQSKYMLITQKPVQSVRHADYTRNCKQQYIKLWIDTLKVGATRGWSTEIVEMLPNAMSIYDVCRKPVRRANRLEKLWESTVIISSFGREMSWDMVAYILIQEKWSESVLPISRVNPCIMMMKMLIEKSLVNVTCIYAPQVGLTTKIHSMNICWHASH